MRTLLLAMAIMTLLGCTKEDDTAAPTPTPSARQLTLRAHCHECIVQWSTSTGANGTFHVIGDTSLTTTVPEGGTYVAQGCAPPLFSVPGGFDTLAALWTSVDGAPLDFHYTVWVDSCAVVGGSVE